MNLRVRKSFLQNSSEARTLETKRLFAVGEAVQRYDGREMEGADIGGPNLPPIITRHRDILGMAKWTCDEERITRCDLELPISNWRSHSISNLACNRRYTFLIWTGCT
jgi:hypothetical protein